MQLNFSVFERIEEAVWNRIVSSQMTLLCEVVFVIQDVSPQVKVVLISMAKRLVERQVALGGAKGPENLELNLSGNLRKVGNVVLLRVSFLKPFRESQSRLHRQHRLYRLPLEWNRAINTNTVAVAPFPTGRVSHPHRGTELIR